MWQQEIEKLKAENSALRERCEQAETKVGMVQKWGQLGG
jgi:hypothetical protein